jgi:DNA repair protein RadD
MSPHIKLRPYQQSAVDSIYTYFENKTGNPLVALPTGTGKSFTMASFMHGACQQYPGTRIVVLTHVKELISQDFEALIRLWPEAPAGIYSAGLGKRDLDAQIVFAGIQSIHRHALNMGRVDLIVVDECHLIPRKSDTMYGRFLANVRLHSPHVKIIGFTATPFRMDSGMLTSGKGALFDEVCYEMTIREAIEDGWLSEPLPKATNTKLDVAGVGTRGGEFIPGQLEKAVDVDETTQAAVAEIIEHGKNRKGWLVFCAGVEHAHHVRDAIRAHGISCEAITGDTPKGERERILRDFKAGRIQCLTNRDVLTTGFDAPHTDLLALLRPTKSPGLLIQMVGRGTRLAPGKENCLVLDFAENFSRHGPIDRIKVKRPRDSAEEGEAPVKVCPECAAICYAGVRECGDCGHEFPEPELKITKQAGTAAVLSNQLKAEWVDVTSVMYGLHTKPGKPSSLKVTYVCGLVAHTEWICFDHSGYARQKACQWWLKRAGHPAPSTVVEALERKGELRNPTRIRIEPDGKYKRVTAAEFGEREVA